MRVVLARRVEYLRNRAVQLAERRRPEGAIDDWQTTMTRASLHLEVAEGATVLGNFDDARFAIRLAVPDLVRLRMPYGAALQRAFVADHPALAADSDALLREWTAILNQRVSGESVEHAGTNSASRVADMPQQWAYYGISSALPGGAWASNNGRIDALYVALSQWLLVPVGRMRFPMDHYLYILRYCEDTSRSGGDVDQRASPGVVVEILAKQLVALFRALQYASVNRYLWSRLLAPAPWFDFDVALLIAAVRAAPGQLSWNLDVAIANTVPSRTAKEAEEFAEYVTEFVGATERLRQGR